MKTKLFNVALVFLVLLTGCAGSQQSLQVIESASTKQESFIDRHNGVTQMILKERLEFEQKVNETIAKDGSDPRSLPATHPEIAKLEAQINTKEIQLRKDIEFDIYMTKRENRKRINETSTQWVDRMLDKYGVKIKSDVRFIFSETSPCDKEGMKVWGCTTQDTFLTIKTGNNVKIYLTAEAVGDAYVLFHEIAHVKGIDDECAADGYSRHITGIPGGFYCS